MDERILNRDASFGHEISDAKSIIGLRNQVIHAYDNVSDENIWSILRACLNLYQLFFYAPFCAQFR
jgi:uncharacterized protein YutE (UPF0331/DUF86 family)